MNMLKVAVVGCVQFSATILKSIDRSRFDVCGVITKKNSSFNSDFADLSETCREFGIDYTYASNINAPEALRWLRHRQPDLGLCVGWSQLFRTDLLRLPKLGFIGYHPAEIPHNRGRHPIIWALALGLPKTASTFFWMDEDADTGDIASQVTVEIPASADASALYQNLNGVACQQVNDLLTDIGSGGSPRVKQPEGGNTWRKRTPVDGKIDWRMADQTIHNLIRALSTPYPGATFESASVTYAVWKSALWTGDAPQNLEPGKVLRGGSRPVVKCGIGAIELVTLEPTIHLKEGDYV